MPGAVAADLGTTESLVPEDSAIEEPATKKAKGKAKAKGEAGAKAKTKAKASKENVGLDLYEVDEEGEVTSGLGRLLTAGFALGATVALKDDATHVWMVVDAEGEHILLRAVTKGKGPESSGGKDGEEGETKKITASSFLTSGER